MIKMYTITMCPYCSAAKRLLKSRDLEYDEINIEKEGMSREQLMELTGGRTVPQIIVNDKPIGGYDDLLVLDRAGELA